MVHHLSFWNLENLFDVETAPRSDKLQRVLKGELAGWDEAVLGRKLEQLARIIRQLHAGAGPDILGVCEVENRSVLERLAATIDLPGRSYAVAHADTADGRGIDVAFLFDAGRYEARETFSHAIQKRTATRDIFQVTLATRDTDRELILLGNHWPSRRGGEFASEPFRLMAGENLAYFIQRIIEEKGREIPVVVMGDFNDEPFSRSLTGYALSSHQRRKVINARQRNLLYNLMWPTLGQRLGTHYFNNVANVLDQFLVTRGLLGNGNLAVDEASARVEMVPDMISTGYPDPIRFSRPSAGSGFNPDGYSDHYPISLGITET